MTTEQPQAYPTDSLRWPQMPRAADIGQLRTDLASVLNRHCRENGSNTPDFVLAQYLANCLDAFDVAMSWRSQWYGHADSIGGPVPAPQAKQE